MGGRGECNTLKPRPLPSLTGLRFVLFVSRGCTRYAVLPLPTLYRPPGSKFRARTDRKLIAKSQVAESLKLYFLLRELDQFRAVVTQELGVAWGNISAAFFVHDGLIQ